MPGTLDTLPGKNIPRKFVREVGKALRQIGQNPQHQALLENLRTAYEYRKQFPWLGESKEYGLTAALHDALASYGFSRTPDPDFTGTPIDTGFKTDYRSSVSRLVTQPSNLRMFAHLFTSREMDIRGLTSQELVGHVAQALDSYSKSPDQGTSLDPW